MEKNELMERAVAQMNELLEHPEIQGDLTKALLAACGIIVAIPGQFAIETDNLSTEIEKLLPPRTAIYVPPEHAEPSKKQPGRPKGKNNPIPGKVTHAAMIAAIWARSEGITNNREAAEKFLPKLSVFDADTQTLKNFQKTISGVRKKYSL